MNKVEFDVGQFSLNIKECQYRHDVVQMVTSVLIIVGMVISYLPQHVKIIRTQSSEGISPHFLLLGTCSAVGSIVNILITQLGVLRCCSSLTAGLCLESLLGIIQIVSQGLLFFVIFLLYFQYFPEERKLAPYQPHLGLLPNRYSEEWRQSLLVFQVVVGHLLFSSIVTFVLLLGGDAWSAGAKLWAAFNGLFSMTLAIVQYIPQIVKTYKRKDCGALSVPTMLIQTPGTFLFVYSLYTRAGTNWTTWITYLVTGVLQGCLLLLCLLFQYRQARATSSSYGPIYIGNVQNAAARPSTRDTNPGEGDNSPTNPTETEPLLLNNHNLEATYEYHREPHQRTKTLLSKWKRGKAGSKVHLVHHSLASNLSERDDSLL